MSKKIRVGLVGTGFAGEFHAENLRRVYGVELEIAGVTSARAASREAFGRKYGIPVYDSAEAMFGAIDLLDICSPPYAHESVILAAARAGLDIICEKPLTGCFGDGGATADFYGNRAPKSPMLREVLERLRRIAAAVNEAGVMFGYAENFVYAPGIQKEREVLEKTGAQILRMTGEESHNGSASGVYGIWSQAGGGSLIGKGCHPLGGMLYLKRVEGLARDGRPIRPATVSARVHELTRLPGYRDAGSIRTDYRDIEDYGFMHVTFDDGTVADVITSEVVLGGIYDYIEVFANNHRARANLSPANLMDVYSPREETLREVYTMEKISTKAGWSPVAPSEAFTMGYGGEIQDFIASAAAGRQPQSDLALACDTTATIYAAYLSAERGGAEVPVEQI